MNIFSKIPKRDRDKYYSEFRYDFLLYWKKEIIHDLLMGTSATSIICTSYFPNLYFFRWFQAP